QDSAQGAARAQDSAQGAARAQDSAQGAARAQDSAQGAARAQADVQGVVVCACGFVSDHLEVLFDLDVEATQAAARLGLPFARTASLNDDPAFCATLADVVRSHAAAAAGSASAAVRGA
ncbi:MAG: ferrochelatase, partial [Acidimicrobiales bacterium]